jgi:hypothetical protein
LQEESDPRNSAENKNRPFTKLTLHTDKNHQSFVAGLLEITFNLLELYPWAPISSVPGLAIREDAYPGLFVTAAESLFGFACFLALEVAVGIDPIGNGYDPDDCQESRTIVISLKVKNSTCCTDDPDKHQAKKCKYCFHNVRFR